MLFGCLTLHASADCFEEAGRHFGVSPDLLRGIDYVESRGRDRAVNRTHLGTTQSYDIGRTQINSRWLPTLAKYGLSESDLYDACTNIHVGAWILSDLIRRYGDTWNAVGAYNAACSKLKGDDCTRQRARYAWDVYRAMQGRHSK
jgi:soluble lytic murein transglycosylase-like protein